MWAFPWQDPEDRIQSFGQHSRALAATFGLVSLCKGKSVGGGIGSAQAFPPDSFRDFQDFHLPLQGWWIGCINGNLLEVMESDVKPLKPDFADSGPVAPAVSQFAQPCFADAFSHHEIAD
jgi:hypothetical protein